MSNAVMNGTNRNTQLAVASPAVPAPVNQSFAGTVSDMMSNPAAFAHMQRVATMYAASDLIPPHLRGKVADVTIAMAMARELGENPLIVMQNIYVVSGRAGWNATYMIARANKSGKFKGSIKFKTAGTGNAMKVTAYATLAETGETIEKTASMEMATAEGWTKNPKYKSLPEQMLSYRAATLLIRLFAPECMLGNTADELEDVSYASNRHHRGDEIIDANPMPAVVPTASLMDLTSDSPADSVPSPQPADESETTVGGAGGEDVIDLSTVDAWQDAMSAEAARQEIEPELMGAILGKIRVAQKLEKLDVRSAVYDAFCAGKLNLNNGKIEG